jgi:hypothetical protein
MLENYDQAHQIVERLQYNYFRSEESLHSKKSAGEREHLRSIESEMLITLLSIKSLYDSENYESCFEIL